jgi:glutathione S-transferase
MTRPSVVLWHIPVSHYNEKARWALDWKGIEHDRKAPPPPLHMAVALARTRGRQNTFPVLRLNGTSIGDSTAIIAALEEAYPEPPLYPADPGERARALELEEFFDEELGPHLRLLAWYELRQDIERFRDFAEQAAPGPLRSRRVSGWAADTFLKARYHVADDDRATIARDKVSGAMDRLEAELGDGSYLVGDEFTVADLTAAALFYPLVLPPEGPRLIADPPVGFEAFRRQFEERRGFRWIEGMFSKHRRRAQA